MAADKMTFSEYYLNWFEVYKEPKVRDVTAAGYLITLEHIRNHKVGSVSLKKLTRKDLQMFFNDHGSTRRKTTVLDTKARINACLADAVQDGFIKVNPCTRIEVNSIESNWTVREHIAVREEKKWLEISEYKRFKMYLLGLMHETLKQDSRAAITISNKNGEYIHRFQPRNYSVQMILFTIYVGLKTGMRYSEVLGLTMADIDFEKGIVNIDKTWDYKYGKKFVGTKNVASIREISVDQEFLTVIEQYFRWLEMFNVKLDSGAIFIMRNARSFSSTVNNMLKRIFAVLEIEPISFHKLRHTQATLLIANNVSLQVIAKRLGHTDTMMIQRIYGHLLETVEEEENKRILELI